MRLAEFRKRLFIFVASRLLEWAGKTKHDAGDVPSPAATQAVGNGAEMNGLSQPENDPERGSVPPDHWTRLITTAPPQPWLDLIREKAPHLLTSPGEEPAEIATEEEFINEELVGMANSNSVENSSTLSPSITSPARDNRTRYVNTIPGKSWLNRLRFSAPRTRPHQDGAIFVGTGKQSDVRIEPVNEDYSVERGSSQELREQGSDLRYLQSDSDGGPRGSLQMIERSDERLTGQQFVSDARSTRAAGELVRVDSESRLRPDFADEPTKPRPVERNAEVKDQFLEQGHQGTESPVVHTDQLPKHLQTPNRPGFNSNARRTRVDSVNFFRTEEQRIRPAKHDSPGTNSRPPDSTNPRNYFEPTRRVVAHNHGPEPSVTGQSEKPTSREMFTDDSRRSSAPNPQHEVEFAKGVWPTLPPTAAFAIADELLMRDTETENRQRLDLEQRGVLWNA